MARLDIGVRNIDNSVIQGIRTGFHAIDVQDDHVDTLGGVENIDTRFASLPPLRTPRPTPNSTTTTISFRKARSDPRYHQLVLTPVHEPPTFRRLFLPTPVAGPKRDPLATVPNPGSLPISRPVVPPVTADVLYSSHTSHPPVSCDHI